MVKSLYFIDIGDIIDPWWGHARLCEKKVKDDT